MTVKRISKIAGVALAGFCVASIGADKLNWAPLASQAAGFAGALMGTIVANARRVRGRRPGSSPAGPASARGRDAAAAASRR